MTVFLQVFVLAGTVYAGFFARAQIRRHVRRWQQRRAWRELDNRAPRRPPATTPGHAA